MTKKQLVLGMKTEDKPGCRDGSVQGSPICEARETPIETYLLF